MPPSQAPMWAHQRSCWLRAALLVSLALAARCITLDEVKSVDSATAEKDPMLFRAVYAAQYATTNLTKDKLDAEELRTVKGKDMTVHCASTPVFNLVITFNATSSKFDDVAEQEMKELAWLSDAMNLDKIEAAESLVDTFDSLHTDIRKACDKVLGGVTRPHNVLVTGVGASGSAAIVGATWAAANYPSAHILLESFGGAWPGNNRFNWTFSQIVDQYYLWPTQAQLASLGNGMLDKYSLGDAMEKLEEGGIFVDDQDELVDDMRDLLEHATTVHIVAGDGTDVSYKNSAPNEGNVTTAEVEAMQAETYTAPDWTDASYEQQLNETAYSYLEASSSSCPIGLCKCRQLLLLAGGIYSLNEEQSPITMAFPDVSMELHGENDADAVIAWDKENRVAYIVSEGTTSIMDIANDLMFIERDYPLSEANERIFDEPEVANGFREQMFELTSDASDENSIEVQLNKMMGDDYPRLIKITGHSLGGAVASLLGPWAAYTWPKATILVVTSGQPKPGDKKFARFYKQVLGRQWRFVHEKDIVPGMPPLDYVKHVDMGMWIHDGGVPADDRPDFGTFELNAEDHNSYLYSLIPSETANITIPDWVKEL